MKVEVTLLYGNADLVALGTVYIHVCVLNTSSYENVLPNFLAKISHNDDTTEMPKITTVESVIFPVG